MILSSIWLLSADSFSTMKTSRSEHKNKVEMVRKETETVFKKLYHLSCNGPKIYLLMEFFGKYSILDSCPDEEWRLSDEALVSDKNYCRYSWR